MPLEANPVILRCWSPSCFLAVVISAGSIPGAGDAAQHPVQQFDLQRNEGVRDAVFV